MVYDTKGLQTMDDMKKDFDKFLLCGYGFFKFMPARLLRKSFIFNEKNNCELQQAIH